MKDFLEYVGEKMEYDVVVFVCVSILSTMIGLLLLVVPPLLLHRYFGIDPVFVAVVELVVYPLGFLIYKYRNQK